MMYRSARLKLYPTKEQDAILQKQLGTGRWLYNHFLALSIRHYKMFGKYKGYKKAGYVRLTKHLTNIKYYKKLAWLQEAPAWSLQAKLKDLDTAYSNFFKYKRGFPKFKRKWGVDTLRFDRNHFKIKGNRIALPKVKGVKFKGRLLEGKIRNATISRTIFGFYQLSVLYEIEMKPRVVNGYVAIDMNCHNLTLDNGEKYELPEYANQSKIRYWQKALARRVKGSNRRFKARVMLAKACSKATRIRNYSNHILTSKIAYRDESQARCVILEDLAISNMTRKGKHKRGLNRSMRDSCLGDIKRMLEYKTTTIKVDRFYPSSKLCNTCGHKNKALMLSDRKWRCIECNTEHDRDINAAINLKKWARNALRGDGVKPSEIFNIPEGVYLGSVNIDCSPAESNI